MNESKIACPFVYANGRPCTSVVVRARAYGPRRDSGVDRADVRKYRLWCSEKWDHAGAISSDSSKERMEFYPDQLADGSEDALWDSDFLET